MLWTSYVAGALAIVAGTDHFGLRTALLEFRTKYDCLVPGTKGLDRATPGGAEETWFRQALLRQKVQLLEPKVQKRPTPAIRSSPTADVQRIKLYSDYGEFRQVRDRPITLRSLNDFVRARNEGLWNCQSECLRSVEVDHQLIADRSLDGKTRRRDAIQN